MKPLFLLGLLVAAPALGQGTGDVLPDPAVVEQAIASDPVVVAAEARLSAARATARALAAGSHEFTASATIGRREVNRVSDFTEYDISLTKPIRLPGKARLDRRAGDAGVRAADNRADDARHQATIRLSEHWWDWLGAAAERRVLVSSAETLGKAVEAVSRRRALRDAASMELELAEAALATARAAARAAAGREAAARAALIAQFPGLPLPAAAPVMPAPALPPEGLAALGALVAQRSHEIGAAMAEAEMAALLAERARRERIPDPSVGLRGFSEFSGAERGVGLLLSIPIGGRHRQALADQAAAEAQASRAQATMIRHDIESLAGRDVAAAEAGFAAWEDALLARTRSRAAADRAARGHALGGLDLAERLYAERVAQEAALAETLARTEAWRAITRLRIDSHTLWMHPDARAAQSDAARERP